MGNRESTSAQMPRSKARLIATSMEEPNRHSDSVGQERGARDQFLLFAFNRKLKTVVKIAGLRDGNKPFRIKGASSCGSDRPPSCDEFLMRQGNRRVWPT